MAEHSENVGNKENMEKVSALMAKAAQVKLGGELKVGVYINYTSDFGTVYEGNVIFKRPTMNDYMKMGAIKSEYLRKAGVVELSLVDNLLKFMAHVMGTLSVVIVKCPEWLKNMEKIQESDVLYHVFGKYEEWEKSFRKLPAESIPADSEFTAGAENLDS